MVGKIKKKKKVGGQQSVSNVSIQPGEQVSKVSILIVHRLSCFFFVFCWKHQVVVSFYWLTVLY